MTKHRKSYAKHRTRKLEEAKKYFELHRTEISARKRAHRLEHLDEERAKGREYYRKNREKRLAAAKKWYAENRDKVLTDHRLYKRVHQRNRYRKLRYGLSPTDYNALLVAQENRCALCKELLGEEGRGFESPHVDHDHATGKVRGIIHQRCNHMLGNAKDDPRILQFGIDYLTGRTNVTQNQD